MKSTLSLILLTTVFAYGCGVISRPSTTDPRILSPDEIPNVLRKIPSYARFSYSGLCFFKGRLYATTNVGLVEFENAKPTKLYKWHDSDDVISGPWFDVADDALWAMHDGLGKLIRFDGTTWRMIDLPTPERGYNRGDVLRGFRGVGTKDGFWFEGGGHAWKWDNSASTWTVIPSPLGGSVQRLFPLQSGLLAVTRGFPVVVQTYADGWNQLSEQAVAGFLVEQSVVTSNEGYVCTDDGRIFRVSIKGIEQIESPGECEAITVTTSGALLTSFKGLGIFEFSNGWEKRFDSPYGPTPPEQWADLAVSENQYAVSVTVKSQGYGKNKTYPGQTALWVSINGKLVPVSLNSL